jgi:hypothetical protein
MCSDKLSFSEFIENNSHFVKSANDYVILFKGNSITRHNANASTIAELGWSHIAGMAASSSANDYAHLLAEMIQKELINKAVKIFFGRGGRPDISIEGIDEETRLKPDLVIVQNGEHSAFYPQVEFFEKDYCSLLSELKKMQSKPQIITIGIWNPRCREEYFACTSKEYNECAKRIENIQRRISGELGIAFAPVSPYENNHNNSGVGSVAGVRWHPNDNGMKFYAQAAFALWHKSIKGMVNE